MAVDMATYLVNICSTRDLNGTRVTPFELWHGTKLKVHHLRIWGSLAYSHIHKDARTD